MREIIIAIKVLARTKLREAAKRTSSVCFNEKEYQRERNIHAAIEILEQFI